MIYVRPLSNGQPYAVSSFGVNVLLQNRKSLKTNDQRILMICFVQCNERSLTDD